MIYNDLMEDIKSADYVLFGLGKEIYASEDKEVYDNLKKIFESMEHVNYFIVSTDKAGAIRNALNKASEDIQTLNDSLQGFFDSITAQAGRIVALEKKVEALEAKLK